MALHDLDFNTPIVDSRTGLVTQSFLEWLLINKRDKANRIEAGTEDNVMLQDEDGHPKDGGPYTPKLGDTLFGTTNQIYITDNGDGTLTLSTPQDINTTSTPTFAGTKGKDRAKIFFYAGF